MRRLGKGLCLCGVVLCMAACSSDKKLPQGERLSILDNPDIEISEVQKTLKDIPVASVNTSWAQTSINPQHIVGNIKAGLTLQEQWAERFGDGISKRDIMLAAPVVQNNRVYVMDSKGLVSAYGLKDGKPLWKNKLQANIGGFRDIKSRASGLAVDEHTLFATTGFGGVFAMDAKTGKSLWRKVMESPIRIAPTITNSMLLIQTADNKIYALDKQNGQELWKFGVAQEDTVIAGGAAPAYDSDDNVVIAGFSNGEIVVLNATIGTPLWSSMLVSNKQVNSNTDINAIGATPIVENGVVYAISNANLMTALDMRSGDKIWEKDIGSMQNMLLAGNYLFTISNQNILYAVDKNTGEVMWSIDVHPYITDEDDDKHIYAAAPLMINGNILLAFSNGKVLKINAAQGVVSAKTNLGIDISNGLIAATERVIAVSDDADVVIFK